MARNFVTANADKVVTALGNTGYVFGPGTLAVICRPTTMPGTSISWAILSLGASTAARVNLLVVTDAASRKLWGWSKDASGVATSAIANQITAGNWYVIAVTKDTGTVAPRFHFYDIAANTWIHNNSPNTSANSTAAVTQANIGSTATATVGFDGDIAVGACWDVVLTDVQCEALFGPIQNWYAPAVPKAMWLLDQNDTAINVNDITGGGADQTSLSGTTVSTASVPGWTPHEGAMIYVT